VLNSYTVSEGLQMETAVVMPCDKNKRNLMGLAFCHMFVGK